VTVLDRAPPFAAATVTAPRASSAALIPTRPARLASACRRWSGSASASRPAASPRHDSAVQVGDAGEIVARRARRLPRGDRRPRAGARPWRRSAGSSSPRARQPGRAADCRAGRPFGVPLERRGHVEDVRVRRAERRAVELGAERPLLAVVGLGADRRCARTSCSGHVPAARTRGTRPAPSSSPTRSALRAAGSSRRRVFRPARVPSLGYATEDRAQTRTWVVGRASLTVTVRRLRRRAREPPPPRHAPPGFAIGGSSLMSAWIVVRNEEHGGGAETNTGTEAVHGAFHGRGRAAPGGDPCRVRLPRDKGWSGYLAGKNSTQGGDR